MGMKKTNWNAAAISGVMGNVLERYKYDGFGRRTVLSADAVVEKTSSEYNWNRAFTGQVLDAETGMMLYRMRYYNVSLGRWTSRDPIGYQAGDENLFRYCFNAPLDWIDSLGLDLHHPYSLYLGGSNEQILIDLTPEQHTEITNYFRKNFTYDEAGRAKWASITDAERRFHIKQSLKTANIPQCVIDANVDNWVKEANPGIKTPRKRIRNPKVIKIAKKQVK
ncbi:MAG: RHS repeat-associated core domain-containing protein [Planctomycetaceae bacterium]|jgi:RHS repeat-associated protein|nr:RHS repeat-associated core domain-containing protein [Planctomycetaceae bacterium]